MPIRWQFLSETEKRTLEEYDAAIVKLLSQRTMIVNDVLEAKIKSLHEKMDRFIVELYDKYDSCTAR